MSNYSATEHCCCVLLDLLIDGLQLFLQHDGQGLHVRLSTRGQQLGAKPVLTVVLVVGAANVHAWLKPGPQQSPALPVWVLHTGSKTDALLYSHNHITLTNICYLFICYDTTYY